VQNCENITHFLQSSRIAGCEIADRLEPIAALIISRGAPFRFGAREQR
jgi:hypothetical protein